ncbi:hypothetical protein EJP617_17290 [Erwinia sp. Ejp617]|nr:hypothetical protein [Erwinia sp. Ejp617]ADP11410.1 hypothetical protein EJP617_17290 [Erwinia sp. Ejp617]
MYAPFDSLTDKKLGFSCSFASSFFQLIIKNIQQDLTARGKLLSELDKTKNSSKLINRYQELAEIPKELRRELADIPEMKGISHRDAFLFCWQHYDLRLPEFYCLSLENLAEQLNCTLDKVKNIVNYFSIASESLHNEKIEHFFLNNPVWARPILEMEESYYCFIPQIFFSFIFPISDTMVEKVDKHKLHKRRSDYLESKIKEIVARRFPSSKVHSSIEWNHECEQYETDLVAVIDSILVIIEAKSHNISSAALRGAPKSVKKHLEEIFVHPSQQSLRFETAIREEKEAISRGKAASMNLPFDLNAVHEIFRISVSLEDFATLQSDLRQFEATGWLPEGFVSCPTMNLADFEIVFDLLEHPVDILHYIKRRIEIEKKYHILGDELDYLGLYLSSFLFLDGFDSDPNLFMNISGMSSSIDRYYLSRDEGVLIEKPRPEINKFFVDVLTRLESRAAPRWSEIGLILKSFHPKDMRTIQKKIGELKKIINRNRNRKGIDDCNDLNSLIYNPPAGYNTALAIVLLKSEYYERRHESYASAADSAMEDLTVKQCLVIGINIDLDDAPYHFIGLFCKDDLSK